MDLDQQITRGPIPSLRDNKWYQARRKNSGNKNVAQSLRNGIRTKGELVRIPFYRIS
jgi:hypothetical protein